VPAGFAEARLRTAFPFARPVASCMPGTGDMADAGRRSRAGTGCLRAPKGARRLSAHGDGGNGVPRRLAAQVLVPVPGDIRPVPVFLALPALVAIPRLASSILVAGGTFNLLHLLHALAQPACGEFTATIAP